MNRIWGLPSADWLERNDMISLCQTFSVHCTCNQDIYHYGRLKVTDRLNVGGRGSGDQSRRDCGVNADWVIFSHSTSCLRKNRVPLGTRSNKSHKLPKFVCSFISFWNSAYLLPNWCLTPLEDIHSALPHRRSVRQVVYACPEHKQNAIENACEWGWEFHPKVFGKHLGM